MYAVRGRYSSKKVYLRKSGEAHRPPAVDIQLRYERRYPSLRAVTASQISTWRLVRRAAAVRATSPPAPPHAALVQALFRLAFPLWALSPVVLANRPAQHRPPAHIQVLAHPRTPINRLTLAHLSQAAMPLCYLV